MNKSWIKRSAYRWLLPLLAVFVLVNLCLDLRSYHNYQDKMNIVEHMIQAEREKGLDTALELLKSGDVELDEGRQLIGRYGYGDNRQNRYYAAFLKECMAAAAGSVMFFFMILAIVKRREYCWRSAQEAYFGQLGHYLLKFRESRQEMPPFPSLEGCEEAGKVNDQLEMLAEYLKQVREQAYQDKEETKSMVTDISHQLKTPVAALDTCFSVLGSSELSEPEKTEFYDRCKSELEGLKILLDSLIQISRLEAGLIRVERHAAPILDTVLAAVNRIYPKASDKQIGIACDYAPEIEQLAVMQDAKWLCEALINILDNAVKYSPNESEIVIAVQKCSSFVKIEIADQGIGIPKKEYHQVFKRFYRGNSSKVREESGTGVGLYLVRKIIGMHHGTVFVKSGYGRNQAYPGSRFVIRLPMES